MFSQFSSVAQMCLTLCDPMDLPIQKSNKLKIEKVLTRGLHTKYRSYIQNNRNILWMLAPTCIN